jgi:hypothetical protein
VGGPGHEAAALAAALVAQHNDAVSVEKVDEDRLRISGIAPDAVGHLAHRQGIEIAELVADGDDLEALFFSLTGSPGRAGQDGGERG